MPDTEDIAIFVRVVELGSLTAAGRDMRMSVAVVSNRIARLEARMGTRLLNRTTRRVQPTQEGGPVLRAQRGDPERARTGRERHLRAH